MIKRYLLTSLLLFSIPVSLVFVHELFHALASNLLGSPAKVEIGFNRFMMMYAHCALEAPPSPLVVLAGIAGEALFLLLLSLYAKNKHVWACSFGLLATRFGLNMLAGEGSLLGIQTSQDLAQFLTEVLQPMFIGLLAYSLSSTLRPASRARGRLGDVFV